MQAPLSLARTSIVALLAAVALAATAVLTAPAAEARGPAAGACVQAGIGTLQELGLLQAAAQKQIDYSTLADEEEGPIFADLPEGSFLSLGEVVRLHTSNPELFAWCE